MLEDFGTRFAFGALEFKALVDEPDEVLIMGRTSTVSRQTQLTYITTAVELARGDEVVNVLTSVAYRVRDVPKQLGDGAFTSAILSRE